jgi:hypothetical protein
MSRRTFMIQVYSDGASVLEDLHTSERVPVPDLTAVGAQIERWLATPDAADQPPTPKRSDSLSGGGAR